MVFDHCSDWKSFLYLKAFFFFQTPFANSLRSPAGKESVICDVHNALQVG